MLFPIFDASGKPTGLEPGLMTETPEPTAHAIAPDMEQLIHENSVTHALASSLVDFAADINAEKLTLATQNGADAVINSREVAFDEEVLRLTTGRGVDVVVEMVGVTETLERSLRSVGTGGRLVWVGTYDGKTVLPVTQGALRGECLLMGTRYCARHELAEAVALVARGRIRPAVTRICQLEEADAVLRSIESKEPQQFDQATERHRIVDDRRRPMPWRDLESTQLWATSLCLLIANHCGFDPLDRRLGSRQSELMFRGLRPPIRTLGARSELGCSSWSMSQVWTLGSRR